MGTAPWPGAGSVLRAAASFWPGRGRQPRQGLRDRVRPEVGRLYGLDEPTTGELLEDLWDWYAGELNTEMVGYFQQLRPRYRTAILSNAAAGGRREEQARYGFDAMADVLVYSYEVGIEKPDRRIYRLTCERLGVYPREAVMVNDVEANVVAAREVGMRAVRFQSTAQAISDLEACLTQAASAGTTLRGQPGHA